MNPNRRLSPTQVANRLAERPDVARAARIVGRWIWVEFDEPPDTDTRRWLKELGFHWNRKRRVWQHPCGRFSKASPNDPRWKYGTLPLADVLTSTDKEEQAA